MTDVNLITGNLLVRPEDTEGLPVKTHRDEVELLSRTKRKKPDHEPVNEEIQKENSEENQKVKKKPKPKRK